MPTNPTYDRLKSLVHLKDNPEFAGYGPVKKVLVIAHEFSGALLVVVEDLTGDPAEQEELAKALELFYKEYVEPIDLPVNDMIEGFVDSSIAKAIDPVVKALAAAVKKRLG